MMEDLVMTGFSYILVCSFVAHLAILASLFLIYVEIRRLKK